MPDDVNSEGVIYERPKEIPRFRSKRESISAECAEELSPPSKQFDKSKLKTMEQYLFLRNCLTNNILFKFLGENEIRQIVNSFQLMPLYNAGDEIITQGDKVAEYFYVLESGTTDVIKDTAVVHTYSSGGCFGELAILYSAPRAATIKAISECKVWGLQRSEFQQIVVESSKLRRENYMKFLSNIPLFDELSNDEKLQIADVLNPTTYEEGSVIINEGEKGETFFLVEDGEVEAVSLQKGTKVKYKRGDYFGELALLNSVPRVATCTATKASCVLSIDRMSFNRLLGKLSVILHRNAEKYKDLLPYSS